MCVCVYVCVPVYELEFYGPAEQQIRCFFIQKMLIFFLFLNKTICPQHMFSSRNKKNIMWIPLLSVAMDQSTLLRSC